MRLGKCTVATIMILLLFFIPAALFTADVHTDIILRAEEQIGNGYCRGGTSPPCFDCSGFICYLLQPHINNLPRTSRDMANYGSQVRRNELLPGDLVFFATTSSVGVISHVALYIGQNSVIHAVSDGPVRGVQISSLDSRYWRNHYHSAARVLTSVPAETRQAADIRYANGLYSGELKQGEPHGTGTLRLDNGDIYEGHFSDGFFHGQGNYTWKNGAVYSGEFAEGRIHGRGVYISARGTQKEGNWEQGEFVTYMERAESPWDSWEGYIRGDFEAWKQEEKESFEAWKRENSPEF